MSPVFNKGKKEDPGKYMLISLTLICGKVMEEIYLETTSKHMKDNMREQSAQIYEGTSMPDQPDNDEMTDLVDGRKAADVVYLLSRLQQAFSSVSHNILIDKLVKYELGKWTLRRTENWLNCQACRVVISGTKASFEASHQLGPILLNIFIDDLEMVGQSARTATFWAIQTQEEWLVDKMGMLAFTQGPWQTREMG